MNTDTTPRPGSEAAVAIGCTCPVMDNGHGAGYMGNPEVFMMNEGCPVHDPLARTTPERSAV